MTEVFGLQQAAHLTTINLILLRLTMGMRRALGLIIGLAVIWPIEASSGASCGEGAKSSSLLSLKADIVSKTVEGTEDGEHILNGTVCSNLLQPIRPFLKSKFGEFDQDRLEEWHEPERWHARPGGKRQWHCWKFGSEFGVSLSESGSLVSKFSYAGSFFETGSLVVHLAILASISISCYGFLLPAAARHNWRQQWSCRTLSSSLPNKTFIKHNWRFKLWRITWTIRMRPWNRSMPNWLRWVPNQWQKRRCLTSIELLGWKRWRPHIKRGRNLPSIKLKTSWRQCSRNIIARPTVAGAKWRQSSPRRRRNRRWMKSWRNELRVMDNEMTWIAASLPRGAFLLWMLNWIHTKRFLNCILK